MKAAPFLKSALFAFLVLFPTVTQSFTSSGKPTGFVNDFSEILTSAQKTVLESKLSNFKQSTGNEITIVTIKNLDGNIIENVAVQLFKEWGVGQKQKDNGVLLLIAIENREVRIEVGYGLEDKLTDARSSIIIRNIIVPAFKEGDYFKGIDEATNEITKVTQGDYSSLTTEKTNTNESAPLSDMWQFFLIPLIWIWGIMTRSKSWWLGGIFGGIIGLLISVFSGFLYMGLLSIAILIPLGLLIDFVISKNYHNSISSGRRPPWWTGGTGFGGRGGGGFGGFGGGGSGGGGASGKW